MPEYVVRAAEVRLGLDDIENYSFPGELGFTGRREVDLGVGPAVNYDGLRDQVKPRLSSCLLAGYVFQTEPGERRGSGRLG